MSLFFERNGDGNSIGRSGFIHDMQCIQDSPEVRNDDQRESVLAEDGEEEDDLGYCSSSSIGGNSDVSGESSSDGEDSRETKVQSKLKGPLDTMDALQEVLPTRKGISKFYNGKSKSFTSLADAVTASSVKEFAKPDNPYNRKRKNLLTRGSKRLGNSYGSAMAFGTTMSSSDLNLMSSSPSSCLPPLHPQYKKSTMISSSSIAAQPNLNPPCRSFSLSDLQFVVAAAAATPNMAGLAVRSCNKDNKMR
ncbi:Photoactivated adenylate cyclase subunit alpha-like protein [Gossypium australe]|uniref:Photoactivated adenylate cyclase subunit alpha-like protein n=1 Tax=Gossypium australe TaxID=47621 RepID=A0A5B6UL14_9ROSI|nr:Photoactivated adenylate cyclase subunit alpha-like protein [Gossypium australe]